LARAIADCGWDEARHAVVAATLAARFGAVPRTQRVQRVAIRSLEEVATENVVEGCVGETYGALVAMWQGRFATDRTVRLAMRRVARDELRHAVLAWQVARWAEPRLDARARQRVRDARQAAVVNLAARVRRQSARSLVRVAGIPPAGAACALFEQARADLWA
jgi:hypothetical protein